MTFSRDNQLACKTDNRISWKIPGTCQRAHTNPGRANTEAEKCILYPGWMFTPKLSGVTLWSVFFFVSQLSKLECKNPWWISCLCMWAVLSKQECNAFIKISCACVHTQSRHGSSTTHASVYFCCDWQISQQTLIHPDAHNHGKLEQCFNSILIS